jgi:hypothetical protein
VHTVVKVQRCTETLKTGKIEIGERHFVTSLTAEEIGDGTALARWIQGHWAVENNNHWMRDALWREDSQRGRSPKLARFIALLRGPILALCSATGLPTPDLFLEHTQRPARALKLLSTPRS